MSGPSNVLTRKFYRRDPVKVARGLLGCKLVRDTGAVRMAGIIVETEAYWGDRDSACHAFRGKTPRTEVMFGEAGHAYVYFIYGMYFMLNVVTGPIGSAWAVLVRGIRPIEGIEEMTRLRGGRKKGIADGPGKLCSAMAIDRQFNGWDLTQPSRLWIERGESVASDQIAASQRIGIDYAHPEHRCLDWRFTIG